MTVLENLATSLKRKDEAPNIELAQKITAANDKKAVKELIDNLQNKNKGIQNDCIKVLYETAALKPSLIAGYADVFIKMLEDKSNRLQWGAMTALDMITNENPKAVYTALPKIMASAEKGSVITNDHCVAILIKLCAAKQYATDAFVLLIEKLKTCPTNQLPMYAENALPVINDKNKQAFITTLTSRLGDIEKETKKNRVEKVIKKLK